MESQAVALHVLAVRECIPSSLLNRRSAIAQLAAVMDAERCTRGAVGTTHYALACPTLVRSIRRTPDAPQCRGRVETCTSERLNPR